MRIEVEGLKQKWQFKCHLVSPQEDIDEQVGLHKDPNFDTVPESANNSVMLAFNQIGKFVAAGNGYVEITNNVARARDKDPCHVAVALCKRVL